MFGMLLAGIVIGAVLGYVGRGLDEDQARRNGWDKG